MDKLTAIKAALCIIAAITSTSFSAISLHRKLMKSQRQAFTSAKVD